ncbi:hypothetical protein ABVT39_014702 [Epinephelus coioides]
MTLSITYAATAILGPPSLAPSEVETPAPHGCASCTPITRASPAMNFGVVYRHTSSLTKHTDEGEVSAAAELVRWRQRLCGALRQRSDYTHISNVLWNRPPTCLLMRRVDRERRSPCGTRGRDNGSTELSSCG